MLPALLVVENLADEVLKVDIEGSYLVLASGDQWRALALDETIDRALRSDAEVMGWGLAFGMVGMFVSMDNVTTVNRTLEQDYHAKYFRPAIINAGQSGGGMVFFERPVPERIDVDAVIIRVDRLNTGQAVELTASLDGVHVD